MIAAHAWRFTHFADVGERTPPPEALGLLDRLGVVFGGVVLPRPVVDRRPEDAGLRAVLDKAPGVSVWRDDGGWRGTVLLFHGYGGTKAQLLDEGAALRTLGWSVVLVDFPGSGDSPGSTTTLGWAEGEVVAALARAHDADPGALVLFGKSMGAAAILRAVGVLGAPADALVLESPYDRLVTTVAHRVEAMGAPGRPAADLLVFWGGLWCGFDGFDLAPVEFARTVTAPTLLLHGADDPRVHLDEVRAIAGALAGPVELELFPGVGHGGLFAADPGRWRGRVSEFLAAR